MDSRAIAFGIGTLLISALLPYLVTAVPMPLKWGGVVFGGLLTIWGIASDRIPVPAGPAMLFIFGVACVFGAIGWHFGAPASRGVVPVKQEAQNSELLAAVGGNGGGAKVFGSGIAFGGPGGSVAISGRGRGGDGGSAEVYGNGIAAGGAGGAVGSDTYWPHPAKNGLDALRAAQGISAPADDRRPGRGGAVPGYEEKLAVIIRLRAQYFAETHAPARDYLDDITAVPVDYLNNAVAASGAQWRAKIVDLNEYDFYIP